MKSFSYIMLILIFTSCVSTKKYRSLESTLTDVRHDLQNSKLQLDECRQNNVLLDKNLASAQHDAKLKDQKIESLQKEHIYKDEKINSLETNLVETKNNNEQLSKRVDEMYVAGKVNVDIMKKMMEESENQNLKILNLSLALQKQDSLNIHLVKRAKKKKVSDEKIKKSLEKLGFVFY
jgi:chemotaxis protein MotB